MYFSFQTLYAPNFEKKGEHIGLASVCLFKFKARVLKFHMDS